MLVGIAGQLLKAVINFVTSECGLACQSVFAKVYLPSNAACQCAIMARKAP